MTSNLPDFSLVTCDFGYVFEVLKILAYLLLWAICCNIQETLAVSNGIIDVLCQGGITSPNSEVQGIDAFPYLSLYPPSHPTPST